MVWNMGKKVKSKQIRFYMCPFCKWGTKSIKDIIAHMEVMHGEEIKNGEIEVVEVCPDGDKIIKIPLFG